MANVETKNWSLLPVATSLNGKSKAAPITAGGQRVSFALPPTKAPFGANNFDPLEKVRMNLDVSCTDQYTAFLGKVDKWAVEQLSKDPSKYFKQAKTPTELRAAYRKCATPHEKDGQKYSDTMRLKIMLDGPNKIRCWTPDHQPRDIPTDFRNCTITPFVSAKSIWLMGGNSAGILWECSDCIVEEEDISCPFT